MLLAGCVEPPHNGTPPDSEIVGADEGWISEDTVFTLNATDDGSGVNATYYRLWYADIWTDWMVYTDPFTLAGEGTHHIEFFSDDMVGNVETVKNATYNTDSTAPETTILLEEPVGTLYVGKVFFDGNETVNCSRLIFVPGLAVELHVAAINIVSGLVEFHFTDTYQLMDEMA